MDNSIYVALSKQVATERQLALLANNMANASTAGYKAGEMMFSEFLMKGANGKTSYALDYGTGRDTSQGVLETTGNQLDLAIQGDGYFAVQTPEGERYSRAGNFTLNEQGQLATMSGGLVLDNAGQPIEFEPQDNKITIFPDGRMEVDGQNRATIGVYDFTDETKLQYQSNNLYASTETPTLMEEPRVAQGMLEQSNVKPILEITKLINTQRSYVSGTKFINDLYELQDTAIRTIAKPA